MSIDQLHQGMMSSFHYIGETQIPDFNKESMHLKIENRYIDESKRDEINDKSIKLQNLKDLIKELKSRWRINK